jgi:hypothetical protein
MLRESMQRLGAIENVPSSGDDNRSSDSCPTVVADLYIIVISLDKSLSRQNSKAVCPNNDGFLLGNSPG